MEPAKKEEMILGAALDVFIEKGRSGARMQEIADRAGISKTLLHYYFRTKENIYAKILETVFSSFLAQMEHALSEESSIQEVLRHFIDSIHDTLSRNPRVPLFMLHELSQGGRTVTGIWNTMIRNSPVSLPQKLFRLMAEEQAAGHIRQVDPAQFMVTLIGSCFYFFMAEPVLSQIYNGIMPDKPYNRETFIAERKKALFDLVYYGLKPQEVGRA